MIDYYSNVEIAGYFSVCQMVVQVSEWQAPKDDTVAIVAEEVPKRERSSEIWGTWRFGLVPRLRKLALLGMMCS